MVKAAAAGSVSCCRATVRDTAFTNENVAIEGAARHRSAAVRCDRHAAGAGPLPRKILTIWHGCHWLPRVRIVQRGPTRRCGGWGGPGRHLAPASRTKREDDEHAGRRRTARPHPVAELGAWLRW